MNNALTVDAGLTNPRAGWGTAAVLGSVGVVAMVFIAVVALPYFNPAAPQLARYWPRRWWLLLHVAAGIVALLSGPVQLWLGLSARRVHLHRQLGIVYIASVTASALAAYYLAIHTDFGLVFGAGLASLATAWLLTTSLAVLAIARHLYDQHKEWMIRSYVVTTAFVTFRLFYAVFEHAGIGTKLDRLTLMAWLCWTIPLLATEAILQGRKIVSR